MGRRKALSLTLRNMNVENCFDFDILSSIRKMNSAAIYGIIKADELVTGKKEKIRKFFAESLRNAVIESFRFDPDYVRVFDFDISVTTGVMKEYHLSPETQEYLPLIWRI